MTPFIWVTSLILPSKRRDRYPVTHCRTGIPKEWSPQLFCATVYETVILYVNNLGFTASCA